MKLKSLLIGSAAVMAASATSAKAADAIVMAEPEPMEYVRICDVYGTGFFYIPGTETCMKIGGYYRFDMAYFGMAASTWLNGDTFRTRAATGAAATGTVPNYTLTQARFAPSFDVRSETELGVLRGFAQIEFNYQSLTVLDNAGVNISLGPSTWFTLAHAYIELQTANGAFRAGKSHRPYARFLGYGANGLTFDGSYGFGHANEISYTFNGSNGFSAIIALVSDGNANWVPDIEGGFNFAQGWGSFGAIAGYDDSTGTWGAKGVLRFSAPNTGFSGGVHVFYTSGAGQYQVSGRQTNWSVLGHVSAQATEKVAFNARAQWFDTGSWDFGASIAFTPVENLLIRPEVGYATAGTGSWYGVLRFQRDIP
ncbi:MAG: porin [Rhizobiaceae bacterium]|nr:porin [Rhizobiaceae bacterium]